MRVLIACLFEVNLLFRARSDIPCNWRHLEQIKVVCLPFFRIGFFPKFILSPLCKLQAIKVDLTTEQQHNTFYNGLVV